MTLHREGYTIILVSLLILSGIQIGNFFLFQWLGWLWLFLLLTLGALVMAYLVIQFFRIPTRIFTAEENDIICPADGKVVVIEETIDVEYFKDKRIQVSIFMSPANVHVNRNPMSGNVIYNQYHKGKYLVAWHPKSSTENERWSVVVENNHGTILYKQIAGALAKRICNYTHVGEQVKQCNEYGFIKFGSRVDILLPVGTKINVQLNEVVKGGVTVLASWS